jgi:hypothetical protein
MSKKAIAAWNDPSSAARRIKLSHGTSDFWKKNGHPRGSLGMVHTPETRALMSRKAIASRNDPSSRHHSSELRQLRSERMSNMRQSMPAENAYSRSKYGKRADLENRFFRSSWEANYARYLNWMLGRGEIHSWAYEAKTFYFKNDGIRSYLPDFEIIDQAGSQPRYVEIKGWMDCKSVKKLELMGTHYPEIRLEIIGEKEYRQLENMSGIPGWERRYTPQDRLRGPQTEICVEGIPTPPPRSTEAVAGLPNAKKCC